MDEFDYASTRDGKQVAFRSYSRGPGELIVYLPGLLYSIESILEDPPYARLINGLAEIRPLVLVERRGVGSSDPLDASLDPWEQWTLDVIAVLDHLGAESASLVSSCAGADIALHVAAHFPDRVSAVVALHPFGAVVARSEQDDVRTLASKVVDRDADAGQAGLRLMIPSRVDDKGFIDWFVRAGRAAASPTTAREFWSVVLEPNDLHDRLGDIDARVMLLRRRDFAQRNGTLESYEAAVTRMKDGILVELDGADGMINGGDVDGLVFEIADFLGVEQLASRPSRTLASLLFTDLVGSTVAARSMGDAEWRTVLDHHDQLIDRTIRRYGGTMIKATGDGALTTFDSPSRALLGALALRAQLEDLRLGVRMGVHLGEIVSRGADVAGVAVHLAARIMSAASPGQILTSAAIPLATMGAGFSFQACGHHSLRGFDQEFEVFEFLGEMDSPTD